MNATENEPINMHHRSVAIDRMSRDITATIKLNRMYVLVCMVSCLGLLGLLVARIFLFK